MNRMFAIGEIRLQFLVCNFNDFGWDSKTFLQLRYMEDIVHGGEGQRQIQLIGHLTTPSNDLKWTNIARCYLPSDLKASNPFKRRHLKIDKIPNLKHKILSPVIRIALLSGLSREETLANC